MLAGSPSFFWQVADYGFGALALDFVTCTGFYPDTVPVSQSVSPLTSQVPEGADGTRGSNASKILHMLHSKAETLAAAVIAQFQHHPITCSNDCVSTRSTISCTKSSFVQGGAIDACCH